MSKISESFVLEYEGERIPVVAQPESDGVFRLISTDGRTWGIRESCITLNGQNLSVDEVGIEKPGPQDDPVVSSLFDFDNDGEFKELSYPPPEGWGS